jgi:hypothetical protein
MPSLLQEKKDAISRMYIHQPGVLGIGLREKEKTIYILTSRSGIDPLLADKIRELALPFAVVLQEAEPARALSIEPEKVA